MAQSTERLVGIGTVENWYKQLSWSTERLEDKFLLEESKRISADMKELTLNGRRRDKAFFEIMGRIEVDMMNFRVDVKRALDAQKMQEMQLYEEKGSLIQIDTDGQAELVVDNPSLPSDNEGTKFKLEESDMKQVPENETKKHGGKRAGAGRKGIGRTEKVSVSLPPEEWDYIDSLIANGHVASRAEYIRRLHLSNRYPDEYLIPLGGGENT
jgi:hypothetical protein